MHDEFRVSVSMQRRGKHGQHCTGDFGSERYAAELLSFNPEYSSVMVFSGGEQIKIPNINIQRDRDSGEAIGAAPWKE